MEKAEPLMTGKVRAVLNPYDFKYYLEHQYSDGEWQRNSLWPSFATVKEAKEYFERAKKARKESPADLGDLNDA